MLSIPKAATPVEVMNIQESNFESKRAYIECKNVLKALLCLTQDTIDDKYIEPLVDDYTNLITIDIPDVMQYLFDTYWVATSKYLDAKAEEIQSAT